MAKPRAQLVDLAATPYYHCIGRCVRRAFLCGFDRLSGRCFDHRKNWIADRLRELVAIFAVEICSYGLMSNHFHLVLYIAADRALSWSDDEVFERYGKLFPHTVKLGRLLSPKAQQRKAALWRKRLYDLSWFMRCLNEEIARRANREDDCTGRFWEGRFRSQALLDTGALLTCMAYVDLNPIRAGIADTLESSDFTSIRERLLAAARVDSLVPFADQVRHGDTVTPADTEHSIPMLFPDYVDLLRWTVGALPRGVDEQDDRSGSQSRQRARAPALLDKFGLDGDGFVDTLKNFPRTFFTMVGDRQRMTMEATRRGYGRRPGLSAARRLYIDRAA